ncbi:MAG: hypothetical protein P1U87_06750 [Verrucomicrobiales bacterium]|nr:hypothetical protein [Verrucomicrobiales bacterium]
MEVFFFFALIIVGVAFFVFRHSKATNEAWAQAASRLRLDFEEGLSIRKMHGKRVDLSLEIRTESVSKATWTKYMVQFAEPLPFPIRLQPQGIFSEVRNAFLDRIDIETGDAAFDSQLVIESKRAEDVRGFLDQRARTAIMKLLSRFDLFEMTERGIIATQKRVSSSTTKLVEDVQLLEASARKLLESARPPVEPARVPPPLPPRKKTEEPAPELPDEEGIVPSTETETPLLEEEIFEVPVPKIQIEPSTFTDPAFSPDQPLSTLPNEDTIFAMHCRELFSDCRSRYEMSKVFTTEVKGNRIEESAILLRAEPFSMDRILGRGPGILRTFSLGKLNDGNELFLVADTPGDESPSKWKQREGQSVTVAGTLVAFDPFSYRIFLKEPVEEECSTIL